MAAETPEVPLGDERRDLLAWGEAVRRDLPWRSTRDPWAVLVSEVMLQQTQVERVVPRWRAFLERWPTTAACAAAPAAEVIAEWQGLGYPRRARWLHAAARTVEDHHGGRFPDTLDGLLQLDGVGPYTARAVLAFAHDAPAAVVDTNVGRVLARRHGRRLTPRAAQVLADEWLPADRPWEWNQALLDLGAGWCRPRRPRCEDCPLSGRCTWALAGHPEPDPAVRSAGVSGTQSRFEGSARQARGRLLRAAAEAPVHPDDWAQVAQWSDRSDASAEVRVVVESLVADGLGELDELGRLVLPSD